MSSSPYEKRSVSVTNQRKSPRGKSAKGKSSEESESKKIMWRLRFQEKSTIMKMCWHLGFVGEYRGLGHFCGANMIKISTVKEDEL